MKKEDRISVVAEVFRDDTTDHQLTILHDDGLYRHLHCSSTSGLMDYFDIVTWPGYLHIGGDRDGFTFSRYPNMFEFFRTTAGWNHSTISPGYWVQKITDGRERARRYSRRRTEEAIWSEVSYTYQARGKEMLGLAVAVKKELIDKGDYLLGDEQTAREAIDNFGFTSGEATFTFEDIWDADLTDWDYNYLWSCYAIQWAINQYDLTKAQATG